MSDVDPTEFKRKLAERRAEINARRGLTVPEPVIQQPPMPAYEGDAPDSRERTPDDIEVDRIIDSLDIRMAYIKWCGKMTPEVKGNQRESIMISCPKPEHADKNPSAWINLDKQVWHCGGCQEGGDKYDIAAYNLGFPVPGYKEGAEFHRLREKMAEGMGWTKKKTITGSTWLAPLPAEPVMTEPHPEPEPSTDPKSPTVPPGQDAPDAERWKEPMYPKPDKVRGPGGELNEPTEEVSNVTPIHSVTEADLNDANDVQFPAIAWQDIVPTDTFLRSYMEQTTIDDVPEEYHFWNGLIALGLAIGRDVTLFDKTSVYANLFVCVLGKTGSGKSQASYHLERLLKKALPYDATDPFSKGVKKVNTPASAEVLVYSFQRPIEDPSNPKKVIAYGAVRGLIDFNELAALVARTQRQGNAIGTTLMEFYDAKDYISTTSMTTGDKIAQNPFASALTTTQPRALGDLLSSKDNDSGFINRWVFAGGVYKTRVAIGGVKVDIDPCVPYLKNVQGWAGFGREVNWTEEAAYKFTQYYHEVLEPTKEKNDLFARVDLLAKKLCLLFALNERKENVTEEIVERVKALMAYVIRCFEITSGEIGNTVDEKIADDIKSVLIKHGTKHSGGMTIRELMRPLQRRKYPKDKVIKQLQYMEQLDEITIRKAPSGAVGQPADRYSLAQ